MRLTQEQADILKYIRNYPSWIDTIETMSTVKAVQYDTDKVQTSPEDAMLNIALQIEDYEERIQKVERCLAYVFETDELIIRARKAFCYGISRALTKYEYYSRRRLFAMCLLEVFEDEINRNKV